MTDRDPMNYDIGAGFDVGEGRYVPPAYPQAKPADAATIEAATRIADLEAKLAAAVEALVGAMADQTDLVHECRVLANKAPDTDLSEVRHIRADRVQERLNATKAAIALARAQVQP